MKLRYLDKKGSLMDPILLGAYILTLGITIFIALLFWAQFQSVMSISVIDADYGTELINIMNDLRGIYAYMDFMIPMLVGGLMILSFILAYRTGASAILAPWAIIVWGVAMLLSAVYTNIYIMFSSSFPVIYTQVPILNFVLENMKWITLFWLFIITIVMFRKNTREATATQGAMLREGFQ